MGAAFPRALSDHERSLLDRLLGEDFRGASELRVQAQTVRARGHWNAEPTVLLLDVADPDAPRAAVDHTVPVEARVRDADPPQELLLFVKDGLLESLELVDYGSSGLSELPAVDDLEPPVLNDRASTSRQPRSLPE